MKPIRPALAAAFIALASSAQAADPPPASAHGVDDCPAANALVTFE